jgi:glyoxylase I family protein
MRLEHVALQVPDPAAMADWYVTHLGCSIARTGGEPAFARFLLDGAGAAMLEIYRNPRVPVPDYASVDPLIVHLAFVSDDVAADRDRLVAAGARLVEDVVTTPAGDQLAMLRDPWKVPLQLVKRAEPMIG